MIGMTEADTATRYRRFAEVECRDVSATYERLASAVADDADLIWRLDALPYAKRQPNLLFGAVRLLGGPVDDPAAFHDWTIDHWRQIVDVMRERRTQTNEPGRCAALAPLLAGLPQPLALLEVGASAGLCLYPDRYAYAYRGDGFVHEVGDSAVRLACDVTGAVPLPDQLPTVVWRAGLDLNPLDVTSSADVAWLEALVWPDQPERIARLDAAVRVAAAEPPLLVRGDLLTDLPALVDQAPAAATLVVFHTSVLAYVPPDRRQGFVRTVRRLPGHWISNEGPLVVPGIDVDQRDGHRGKRTVVALDGEAKALAAPHGQALDWLD